jgi:uncharacterized delta-60 repeat protein
VCSLNSRCSRMNLSSAVLCRLVACLVLAAAPSIALAQAGQLDSSFGTNGIFSSTFNSSSPVFATSVALQGDGKIVVGGEAGNPGIVLRLNSNGTLDTSFASAGVFSIRFRDVQNLTVGVAVQPDGKILAVGTGLPQGGQLIRLNSNGSLDSAFGSGGSVALALTPAVLALQPDGNILVGGAIEGQSTRVMMRFTSTGQVDTAFGSGGTAALVADVNAIALQSDGKILIGGAAQSLTRYNTNGSLDTTFGIGGQVSDLAGPGAVALQSNGQIITAGSITSSLVQPTNGTGFGLTAYFPSGFPTFLFGTHGGAITPFPGFPTAGATSMAIQTNNFIVAGGQAAVSPSSSVFAVARYVPGGQLDNSFGSGGLVTTGFGNGTSAGIAAIVLQSDGKIVAVGQSSSNGLVVARYLGH